MTMGGDPVVVSDQDSASPPKFFARFRREREVTPDLTQLPTELFTGPHRDRAIEILNKPVTFLSGREEMFPCHQQLLEWLVAHPQSVGEYWKELGISITDVELCDGGYVCRDPSGTVVHFYVVCDQPNLRVCYCIGEAPAVLVPMKMRAELVIVHRFRFQEYPGAGTYVVQQLDGFASANGPTLKLAMKLAPGQAEQMVDACVREMKVFFSVMCRLMQLRPEWSLEKLPQATHQLGAEDRQELEGILRSLPMAGRPPVRIPLAAEESSEEPAAETASEEPAVVR